MNADIRLLPLCLAMLLAACGGAEEEEDVETPEDADAAGYWTGTATPDGGTSGPSVLYVAPDGKFYMEGPRALMMGSGDTNGASFSATSTGWPTASANFTNGSASANFTLSGTIAEFNTVNGAYTGGGESGTFRFTYDSFASTKVASLAAISGSYTLPTLDGSPSPISFTIDATGVLRYQSSSGCVLNGTVQVLNAAGNYYGWSATPTGCPTVSAPITGFGWMPATTVVRLVGTAAGRPVLVSGVRTTQTPATGTAEGVYGGTVTGSQTVDAFRAIVLENGSIWAFYGRVSGAALRVESFVEGPGSSSNGSYTATVKDYADDPAGSATVTATYNAPAHTLTGSVASSDGTLGFSAAAIPASAYDYNAAASVTAIAGAWSVTDLEGDSYSVSIASNGSFTFTEIGGSCSGTGLFVPRASGKNVFDMTVNFGASMDCELPNQTAQGVALAYPLAGGQTQFVAAGTNSARTVGTVLFGVR